MGRFKSISEFEFVKDPKKNKVQLGVGSFGEVKLAMHRLTQMKYAIKIMNLKNMNSMQEVHGIEREVRVHSTLQHDNIIEYFDSFQENEMVYIVLGYASNGNLYSHLFKKKVFSEKEAYKYFSQTCQAIKYLHSINIVHRDLKPENILLDEGFNIKVCDFGWCTEDIENPRRTFCGTYEYMAPEIVFRQQYDYRIDVWALGVLVYELLHGSAPFKGKNFQEIQRKIEKGDVKFSDTISDQSKHLICKVLQANPLKRISIDDILNHPWMQRMMVLAENTGGNENSNQQGPPNSKVLAKKNESCNMNQIGKDIGNNDNKNKSTNNNNLMEVNQIKISNQIGQGGVILSQESSEKLTENKKSSQHVKSLSSVTPIKLPGGGGSQSKIAGLSSSPYLTQTPQQLNFLSSPTSTPYTYKYNQQASTTTNTLNPMPLSIENQNTPIQPLLQSKHNNPYNTGSSISKNAQNSSYLENFKSSGKKQSSQSKSLSTLPISLETIFKGVTSNNNNIILGNNSNNAISFPGNMQPLSEKSLNTYQHTIQPSQSPTNHCNYNYNSTNPPAPATNTTTIAALSINLNSQFNNPSNGSAGNSNANKIHSFSNLEPTAYTQDIDENSIQSSMKTINTSKFVNRQLPLFSTTMNNTNTNANPSSQNPSLKPQSTNVSQSQPNFFISGQQALQAVRQLVLKQRPENSQNQEQLLKQQQQQQYQQNVAYQSLHQPQQQQPLNGLANQLSNRTIRERSINQSNRNYQNSNNNTIINDQQPSTLHSLQTIEMLDLDQVRPRIKSANTTSNHVSFLSRQQQPSTQQNQQERFYDQSQYNTNSTSNQHISLRSSCNKPFQVQTNNNSNRNNSNNNGQYSFNRMNSRSGTSDSLVNFTPIISSIPTKSITLIEQPSSSNSALAAVKKTLETSFHSNNNNHNQNPTTSPKNNRSFNQDLILQTLNTLPSQSSYVSKTQPSQYASKTQPAFYPIQQLDQSHQNQQQQYLSSQQSSPSNKYPQASMNYLNTFKVNVNTLKADETRVKDANNISNSSNNNSMLRSGKKSSQRSRTLIFQPLNNSKTNSVLHSIDQMIFQVKNTLPMEREDNNDGSFYQQQALLSQHQQTQPQLINSAIQRKNTENQFNNQQERFYHNQQQFNQRELTTEPSQGHYSTQGSSQQLPPATASSTQAQYPQQFQFPVNSQNIQDFCNTQGLEQLSTGGSTPMAEQGQYSQQLQQSQNQNSQRVQRSITGKTKLKIFDCREKTSSASFHTQSQRITQYHTANSNNNNNNYSNNEGNINIATTASQRLLSLANITVNNYFPQLTNSNNNSSNLANNNCSNNQKITPFQPMKQPPPTTLTLNTFNSNICDLQQQQQFLQSSNSIFSSSNNNNNRVLF